MRIATAPVNWNNEDVQLRPWVPYPELLHQVRGAGYQATEWAKSLPRDAPRLREDAGRLGLRFLGSFVGLDFRKPELRATEIQRALDLASFLKELGCSYLIAADSGDPRRRSLAGRAEGAGLSEPEWDSLIRGFGELGRALAGQLRLVVHNHVGTYLETQQEVARLLDGTDPALVGWCLDCGHLAYGGGDTLGMLADYGARVEYVHIKDLDGALLAQARAQGWSFEQALTRYVFAELGKGSAQVPEVVKALAGLGYDGWLVIEQDTTPGDPAEVARRNREYLEGLLGGR
jgi:inosose dehydratase